MESQEGHREVSEMLLGKGASMVVQHKDGATVLMMASQEGHREVVKMLVGKGASMDVQTKDGRTEVQTKAQPSHSVFSDQEDLQVS